MCVAAVLLLPSLGHAETVQRAGAWEISTDKDRFTGSTKVIGTVIQKGRMLAVRCFPSGLSIAIAELSFGQGRFAESMPFEIKFRAGDGRIIETEGVGLNDKVIQVDLSPDIFQEMKNAKEKEFAFRITYKTVTFDMIFKAGKGFDKVFKAITNSCPLPA